MEGEGVWLGVGVCVGDCEDVAVREGEADRLAVVVGVGEGERLGVLEMLSVGVTDGVGVCEGVGVGRMQTVAGPEPNCEREEAGRVSGEGALARLSAAHARRTRTHEVEASAAHAREAVAHAKGLELRHNQGASAEVVRSKRAA